MRVRVGARVGVRVRVGARVRARVRVGTRVRVRARAKYSHSKYSRPTLSARPTSR